MLNENLFLAKRYLKTNVNHITYFSFSICTSNLIYIAHFANFYFYHFIILLIFFTFNMCIQINALFVVILCILLNIMLSVRGTFI